MNLERLNLGAVLYKVAEGNTDLEKLIPMFSKVTVESIFKSINEPIIIMVRYTKDDNNFCVEISPDSYEWLSSKLQFNVDGYSYDTMKPAIVEAMILNRNIKIATDYGEALLDPKVLKELYEKQSGDIIGTPEFKYFALDNDKIDPEFMNYEDLAHLIKLLYNGKLIKINNENLPADFIKMRNCFTEVAAPENKED